MCARGQKIHFDEHASLYVKPSGTKTEVLISTLVFVNNKLGEYILKWQALFLR